jgi:hypothetical protein
MSVIIQADPVPHPDGTWTRDLLLVSERGASPIVHGRIHYDTAAEAEEGARRVVTALADADIPPELLPPN